MKEEFHEAVQNDTSPRSGLSRLFAAIAAEKLIESRECLSAVKHWGYDSPYDGEVHAMDICTDCYQKWISTFAISPVLTEAEEG